MLEIYNNNNIVLFFTIYSFLGWIAETIYCFIIDKKFTYRGFLYGPVCPIYGTGALIVIFSLTYFEHNILLLFLFGVLLTSTLEYFTSYILEKVFHMKWWDYSEHKFNINGRVCLLNSTMFGLLSVILMDVINPRVIGLVGLMNDTVQMKLSNGIFIVFVIDATLTVAHLLDLKDKLKNLKDIRLELSKLGVVLSSYADEEIQKVKEQIKSNEVKEKMFKLEENINDSYKYKRILNSYSNSKHKLDNNGLRFLRDKLKNK